MSPVAALGVLAALVALATVAGVLQARRAGRIRAASDERVTPDEVGVAALGADATLLQLSTERCAPCRSTARLLTGVAAERPRVTHVEVDLAERPGLADRFGVLQTPTTLLLDARGVVRGRIGGVPRTEQLAAALDELIGAPRA